MKVKHLLDKYPKARIKPSIDIPYVFQYGRRTKVKGQNIIRDYNTFEYKYETDIPEFILDATVSSFYIRKGVLEVSCYERGKRKDHGKLRKNGNK